MEDPQAAEKFAIYVVFDVLNCDHGRAAEVFDYAYDLFLMGLSGGIDDDDFLTALRDLLRN